MEIKKLNRIIQDSYNLDPQDDDGYTRFRRNVSEIMSRDINGACDFILNSCSDEDFYWLSPVFEEITQRVPSKIFCETIQKRLDLVREEDYLKNQFQSDLLRNRMTYDQFRSDIQMEIDYAEGQLWQLEDDSSDQQ